MSDPRTFATRLGAIAKLTQFDLDAEVIALYDRALAPLGYDRLVEALDKIGTTLAPGSAFPSCSAIQQAVTGHRITSPERLADDEANGAVGRIMNGVRRVGSLPGTGEATLKRFEQLKAELGPVSWEAVTAFGGWNSLCDLLTYDNQTTVQAQLRGFARAAIAAGRGHGAPALASPEDQARPRIGGLSPVSASEAVDSVAHLTPKAK